MRRRRAPRLVRAIALALAPLLVIAGLGRVALLYACATGAPRPTCCCPKVKAKATPADDGARIAATCCALLERDATAPPGSQRTAALGEGDVGTAIVAVFAVVVPVAAPPRTRLAMPTPRGAPPRTATRVEQRIALLI